MASVDSNKEEIRKLLLDVAECVDFTLPGEDKSLGEDCLDAVSEGIQDRTLSQQTGADGAVWPENAPRYKRTPKKAGKPIGVLSGEMVSDVQLQGTRTIEARSAVMLYGTDEDHRDRLSWFERGSDGEGEGPASGATNQPPRPDLYALDDAIIDGVMDVLERHVDRRLAEIMGGG